MQKSPQLLGTKTRRPSSTDSLVDPSGAKADKTLFFARVPNHFIIFLRNPAACVYIAY
jgi:hypothetical protein